MPSVKRTSFSTYQSYVTVVPRIIVHQCCSIPHSCNLVPIIPPGHNTSLVVCILSQPIVSFSEIIQDCPTPVTIRKFIYCIYRTYMYKKIMSFLLLNIKEISLQILESTIFLGQIGEDHTISQWFVHFVNQFKRAKFSPLKLLHYPS